MATHRPAYTLFDTDGVKTGSVTAPAVFGAPLRPDLVNFVVNQMNCNSRQAYAVTKEAGYQTAAESWGTGRAVARIPRVPGGGTHRAGQAAFGNMCRGGGMFNPTKIWRKWHRKLNVTQKRHAMAAAIASTAVPALVMARGHRVDEVPEMPLVIKGAEGMKKTRDVLKMMLSVGLGADLDKVVASKSIRAGQGKMRNRRYVQRKGPLIVHEGKDGIERAARNIPGVETCKVDRMNLLKLAPGGHMGRMVIYTEEALKSLNSVWGTYKRASPSKKGYHLPRAVMTNADLARLINSEEIQSVIRPMRAAGARKTQKKNALKNKMEMAKINPGSGHRRYKATQACKKGTTEHKIVQAKKTKNIKRRKTIAKKAFFKGMEAAYKPKAPEAEEEE